MRDVPRTIESISGIEYPLHNMVVIDTDFLRNYLYVIEEKEPHMLALIRMFGCRCLYHALHKWENAFNPPDSTPRDCLKAIERYIFGLSSAHAIQEVGNIANARAQSARSFTETLWSIPAMAAKLCCIHPCNCITGVVHVVESVPALIGTTFPIIEEFYKFYNVTGIYKEVYQQW